MDTKMLKVVIHSGEMIVDGFYCPTFSYMHAFYFFNLISLFF